MKNSLFLILTLGLTNLLLGQSLKELNNQSKVAYEAKDYAGFLRILKKMDSIRPAHPTFMYNLACAYALNNEADHAFNVLEKCILNNKDVVFETESDLQSLKPFPKFEILANLKKKLSEQIETSFKQCVLEEKELHPESVLFLEKQKLWLAGSVRKRKIVSFDIHSGKCIDWYKDENMLAVMSLKMAPDAKTIWVCTSAMPEMEGFDANIENRSEVLQIDIVTRKILQRIPLLGKHVLGDLLVTPKGDVFITDSVQPLVYKLEKGNMITWLDLSKQAFNLQGIAYNAKDKSIFIADYLKGILKVNLSNPLDNKWLTVADGITLKGIDGLYCYKNSLIAIQNGVNPIRIVRFELDNTSNITNAIVLDHNRLEFKEPTLGYVVNNDFYFIANAPWQAYDSKGNLDSSKVSNPMLYVNKLK